MNLFLDIYISRKEGCFVTKKRGSDYIQQHTDCLQRTLVSIRSWSTAQIQTSDLPNTQTSYWLLLQRISDQRPTRTATKQTLQHSSPASPIHTNAIWRNSLIALQIMYIPRKHKHCLSASIHKTPDPVLSSLSVSLSLLLQFLSNSSAAAARLITRRSERFWHSAEIS
jgi:hypothetical protein